VAVCKHCHRQLSDNRSGMCRHYRMKHNKPPADVLRQIDPPASEQLSHKPASEPLSDKPASEPLSTKPAREPLSEYPQRDDADMSEMVPPLAKKRANDARRYVTLCATTPIAFRRAIDALPKSSIRRIYDAVCNVAKGDAQVKFSPKHRRLCSKYRADSRASSKTKRRLLRSAKKEAIRSVFAPLMLHTAFGAFDSEAMLCTNID